MKRATIPYTKREGGYPGYEAAPGLAVARYDRRPEWYVHHLPTGHQIPHSGRWRRRKDAGRFAELIADALDWTQPTFEGMTPEEGARVRERIFDAQRRIRTEAIRDGQRWDVPSIHARGALHRADERGHDVILTATHSSWGPIGACERCKAPLYAPCEYQGQGRYDCGEPYGKAVEEDCTGEPS